MKFIFSTLVFFWGVFLHAQNENPTRISLEELISEGARPQLLADGFRFTEGPAADASGNIYFTDIGSRRIHYWNVGSGELSIVRENSNGADGL